jgi:hypothetical protein
MLFTYARVLKPHGARRQDNETNKGDKAMKTKQEATAGMTQHEANLIARADRQYMNTGRVGDRTYVALNLAAFAANARGDNATATACWEATIDG